MLKSQKQQNIYQKSNISKHLIQNITKILKKHQIICNTIETKLQKNKINKNYKHTYKTRKITDFSPQMYILHFYITQIYFANNDYFTILIPVENSIINPLYQDFFTIIIS